MKKLFQNPYFLLLIITAAGAGLRFYHLGYKSLWFDEAVTYWNAQGNPQEILQHNATSNSAPPTFTFLMHYISKIGTSEFMLRLIPCIAGILAIPLAFLFFKQFFGPVAALAPTILLTFSAHQIQYSQEVREYSITTLFTLLIVYYSYRVAAENKKLNYIFFSIVLCFSLFIQYGLALVIAAACVLIIIEILRNRYFKKIVPLALSLIAPFICLVLLYHISLKYHMTPGGRAAETYLKNTYWDGSFSSLSSYILFNSESIVRYAYAIETKTLLIAFLLLGIYACFKYRKFYPLALAVMMFSSTLLFGLLSLYPYSGCRQTIFLTIPVYLLAGVGFYYLLQHRSTRPFFFIALAIFAIYGLMHSYQYLQEPSSENIRPILSVLEKNIKPEDKIFVDRKSLPAYCYYNRQSQYDISIFYERRKDREENLDTLNTPASQTKRLWLVFTHCSDKDQERILSFLKTEKNAEFQTFYVSNSCAQKLILAKIDQRVFHSITP